MLRRAELGHAGMAEGLVASGAIEDAELRAAGDLLEETLSTAVGEPAHLGAVDARVHAEGERLLVVREELADAEAPHATLDEQPDLQKTAAIGNPAVTDPAVDIRMGADDRPIRRRDALVDQGLIMARPVVAAAAEGEAPDEQ